MHLSKRNGAAEWYQQQQQPIGAGGSRQAAAWTTVRSGHTEVASERLGGSSPDRSRGGEVKASFRKADVETLRRRLSELDARKKATLQEDRDLRQEHAASEAAWQAAKCREERAQEGLQDARKSIDLRRELVRSEVADLMKQLAGYEQSESEFQRNTAAWRGELDHLVLEQASRMAERDQLKADSAQVEATARRDEARAAELEARIQRAEEKCNKERLRVDLLTKEITARRQEASEEQAEAGKMSADLRFLQTTSTAVARLWRRTALSLAAIAGVGLLWRLTDPALW